MRAAANTAAHAVVELLARYRAIFKAAWDARHELAGPKRLADEAAFLPAALSLQDTPVHPAPRRTMGLIMALFVIALVWSIVGQVDIVAVGGAANSPMTDPALKQRAQDWISGVIGAAW